MDRIKKKGAFKMLATGEVVEIPKSSVVELVDGDGEVRAFYTPKKGRMSGPALVRTTPVAPDEAPGPFWICAQRPMIIGLPVLLLAMAVLGVVGLGVAPPRSGLHFLSFMGAFCGTVMGMWGLVLFLVEYGVMWPVQRDIAPPSSLCLPQDAPSSSIPAADMAAGVHGVPVSPI